MHFCLLWGEEPTLGRTLTRLRQITLLRNIWCWQYMVLIIQLVTIHPWWFSEYSPSMTILNWSQENLEEKESSKHNWGDQCKGDTLSAFARSSVPPSGWCKYVSWMQIRTYWHPEEKERNTRSTSAPLFAQLGRPLLAREIHFQSLPDLQFPLRFILDRVDIVPWMGWFIRTRMM